MVEKNKYSAKYSLDAIGTCSFTTTSLLNAIVNGETAIIYVFVPDLVFSRANCMFP